MRKFVVFRNKYTKWYFTCNDYVILQDETWVILTILQELEEFGDGGVLRLCLLEELEEVRLWLWRCACLAKFRNFVVFWYDVDVSGKLAECVSDYVGFAG